MKQILCALALALTSTTLWAQEALFDRNDLTSPEVSKDGTVTFRLYAPKAVTVSVEGDFQAAPAQMKEGKDGVWTYTTQTLAPEMYSYRLAYITSG